MFIDPVIVLKVVVLTINRTSKHMTTFRAALFDVDGVLLDSLMPHLKICEDKNKEYHLGLTIPGPSDFREIVRRGVRISPMKYFFMAVGFPEQFAEKANREYQEIFMRDYAPAPFPGVAWTLRALHDAGQQMGIVTSNVRANVVEALGDNMKFLNVNCIYCKDDIVGLSKSEAIVSAMDNFQVSRLETIYIGDQPADWDAAKTAGVTFLGVSYGWGISEGDTGFPVVTHVCDIYRYISAHNHEE